MRIFEHPNMNGFICPVCGKSDDKPVTLVGISGTEDGGNMEARQVHVDCIDLISYKVIDGKILIGMVLDEVYE